MLLKRLKKEDLTLTASHSIVLKKRFIKGVKYIKVDVTKIEDLKRKITKSYNYVINAGGYGLHPDFGKKGDLLIKSHFLGLLNILKILKKKDLKKFVQIGSSAEYGKIKPPIKESSLDLLKRHTQ